MRQLNSDFMVMGDWRISFSLIYSRCGEVVNGMVRHLQNVILNDKALRIIIEWAMLAGQELFKVGVEL